MSIGSQNIIGHPPGFTRIPLSLFGTITILETLPQPKDPACVHILRFTKRPVVALSKMTITSENEKVISRGDRLARREIDEGD